MKRVSIATLGCKVNTFESELIMQRLCAHDYARVANNEAADICIINSCTVTAEADRKSRQLARKFKKNNPEATVIMTGCYAQNQAEKIAQSTEVDWVVGNAAKLDLPRLIIERDQKLIAKISGDSKAKIINETFSNIKAITRPDFDKLLAVPQDLLSGYESQSRAFIQIQQGCDQGCTFCIIHVARGPSTSFPAEVVLSQFRLNVEQGYKEIVICGVDLGAYGDDFSQDYQLLDLLKAMLALKLDCRIRISSIDPYHLNDDLINLIGRHPQICSQIHLSMQSANSLILKRMKRRSNREMILEQVQKLRNLIPNLVLSADVLVGFPTETEEHFADTLSAIKNLEIAYPHVFPYSNREGTPAARIPKQVETSEKQRRAKIARAMGEEVWQVQAQKRIGEIGRAIVESKNDDGSFIARRDDYFPVKVAASALNSQKVKKGGWCQLKITGIKGNSLLGEIALNA